MKIRLFELRQDELSAFERAAGTLPKNYSIDAVTEPLSADSIDGLKGYEAIVITNKSLLTADIVARLQQLGVRYVSSRCVGFNHIDLPAVKAAGIRVCNTTYPPYGVAEFAIMLMLMALRKCKPAIWRMQVNDYSL